MMTIGQVAHLVSKAARELRAANIQPDEEAIRWWLNAPRWLRDEILTER